MHGVSLTELYNESTKCVTDVIRAYQSKHLYDSHKMINLFVFRENISKSFQNEVLATSTLFGFEGG